MAKKSIDVKAERVRAGMLQVELAKKAKIPQCRLSLIENKWVKARPKEMAALRRALGLSETSEQAANAISNQ